MDQLEVLEALRAEVKSITTGVDAEAIGLRDDIAALGIDSLSTLLLISQLESRLGVALPDYQLTGVRTVGDLVDAVVRIAGETR